MKDRAINFGKPQGDMMHVRFVRRSLIAGALAVVVAPVWAAARPKASHSRPTADWRSG